MIMSWSPTEVIDMLGHLEARLEAPEDLADELVARAKLEPDVEELEDESEVVDILEQLDRGYLPLPEAHVAVCAAALLVRLVLACRVAERNDAWVVIT